MAYAWTFREDMCAREEFGAKASSAGASLDSR